MPLDVVVRMSAQEAGAYRAWLEQQRAVKDTATGMSELERSAAAAGRSTGTLEQQLDAISRRGDTVSQQARNFAGELDGVAESTGGAKDQLADYVTASVGGWATVAGGVQIAKAALAELGAALREVRQEEAQTTFNLDAVMRNIAVQAGLKEADLPELEQHVFAVARAEGMDPADVARAMQQLISSGYSAKQVIAGGIGHELVQNVQAMAGGGENFNIVEGAKALAQYLKGTYGLQGLTEENTRKELRELGALFYGKDIQLEDLTFIARSAGQAAKAGIDSTTYKATYTRLRDQFNSEMAGTALRSIIASLQTAVATDSKTEGLAMLGLKPENVDLQGEDWLTVWASLNRALATVDQTTGAAAFKKLFETESMNQALALAQNYRDIAAYSTVARDWSQFEGALAVKTGGEAAALAKLEAEIAQQRIHGAGAEQEIVSKAIEADLQGVSGKIAAGLYDFFAPFIGNENALRLVIMAPVRPRIREKTARALAGSMPLARATAAPAPAFDEAAFESAEAERREAAEVEARSKAPEPSPEEEAAAHGGKLVRDVLSQPGGREQAHWDPEELAAMERLRDMEASAAEQAFSRGVITSLTQSQVRRFHQQSQREFEPGAFGPTEAPNRLRDFQREERLIQLLEQIVNNTAEPEVRIKNLGDEKRSKRRKTVNKPKTQTGWKFGFGPK